MTASTTGEAVAMKAPVRIENTAMHAKPAGRMTPGPCLS